MAGFNFSVKVYPFQSRGAARAFASVIIDDVVEIKNFKVIEGRNGLFVSAPQTKSDKEENKWYPDIRFHEDRDPDNGVYKGPVEQEICDAILAAYQETKGQSTRGSSASANRGAPSGGGSRPDTNPMTKRAQW